jgi:hypothetical protein
MMQHCFPLIVFDSFFYNPTEPTPPIERISAGAGRKKLNSLESALDLWHSIVASFLCLSTYKDLEAAHELPGD